jgi:hypothetical protein
MSMVKSPLALCWAAGMDLDPADGEAPRVAASVVASCIAGDAWPRKHPCGRRAA